MNVLKRQGDFSTTWYRVPPKPLAAHDAQALPVGIPVVDPSTNQTVPGTRYPYRRNIMTTRFRYGYGYRVPGGQVS